MGKSKQRVAGLCESRLRGLPGTKDDVIAKDADTVDLALRIIRRGRAVHGYGPTGAITVWRDDSRQWRCELQRYCTTIEAKQFRPNDRKSVEAWLREWWPALGREDRDDE